MSDDHFHYASDIHGGAEEHHRHYDLENDIERARDQEVGAEKVYLSGAGYLHEVIADLQAQLTEVRAKQAAMEKMITEAVQYAEREVQS